MPLAAPRCKVSSEQWNPTIRHDNEMCEWRKTKRREEILGFEPDHQEKAQWHLTEAEKCHKSKSAKVEKGSKDLGNKSTQSDASYTAKISRTDETNHFDATTLGLPERVVDFPADDERKITADDFVESFVSDLVRFTVTLDKSEQSCVARSKCNHYNNMTCSWSEPEDTQSVRQHLECASLNSTTQGSHPTNSFCIEGSHSNNTMALTSTHSRRLTAKEKRMQAGSIYLYSLFANSKPGGKCNNESQGNSTMALTSTNSRSTEARAKQMQVLANSKPEGKCNTETHVRTELEPTWDHRFAAIVRFKDRCGAFPASGHLHDWLQEQKRAAAADSLSVERTEKLHRLGINLIPTVGAQVRKPVHLVRMPVVPSVDPQCSRPEKTKRKYRTKDQSVPLKEMQRLMKEYGPTVVPRNFKPPDDLQTESLKRKFSRWFPDLEERFVASADGLTYTPKAGHDEEVAYRCAMRKKSQRALVQNRNNSRWALIPR